METRLIFSSFPPKPHFTSPRQENLRQLSLHRSAVSPNSSSRGSSSNGGSKETSPPTSPNIRYRARSRRQLAKQEKQRKREEEEEEDGLQKREAKPPKKWEEMKLSEKAMELYLGEKGLLFWLNKLAYASIFAVIGGWILFRFVGPSLGLYQLDSPPLSPSSIFKNG